MTGTQRKKEDKEEKQNEKKEKQEENREKIRQLKEQEREAKDAAGMFDSMMPDQKQLVVKILQNMTAAQRSAILPKMNVQNASDITIEMDKELP